MPDDGDADDFFGYSVSVSGDTLMAGAPTKDSFNVGAAYSFVRDQGSWSQEARLEASDATSSDFFGWSVSLSGGTALIGARGDDDRGQGSGALFVFERSLDTWTEKMKLGAGDGAVNDHLGSSVALSGNHALASAPDDDDNGLGSGSAYVFELAPAGDGFALEFDGVDDLVTFGTVPGVAEHTIEAWVNLACPSHRVSLREAVGAWRCKACDRGRRSRTVCTSRSPSGA